MKLAASSQVSCGPRPGLSRGLSGRQQDGHGTGDGAHCWLVVELALLVCPLWRDGQLWVLTGHPHPRPMWWVTAGTMACDCTSL